MREHLNFKIKIKKMKKVILLILIVITAITVDAQIPYYSGSQGKGNTYTYFSTKFHPGHNNQSIYITASHGVLDKLDIVTDATVGTDFAYQGFGIRFNAIDTEYFGLGGQVMIDFDLNDSYKIGYNANSIYMNGKIHKGLHWVLNEWHTWYPGGTHTVENWTYLGWTIKKVTPMIGLDNYWTDLDKGVDLMVGAYWNAFKRVNLYLWGSNLTSNLGDPRVVLGIDYKF